jgi:hypothetical protein
MKLILNSLFVSFLLTFSAISASSPLDIEARKVWPKSFSTVGEVMSYFLVPTGYSLYLDDRSSDIANLRIATLPSGEILPITHIFLEIIPSNYVLIVDNKRKRVSLGHE